MPHERFLLKLQRHGIDGSLLLWIGNFLTNRRQHVVLRGSCSDWSPVISGVPQGTILGPILFINDISTNITSTVKIYADDTKIYRTIIDPDKDILALQLDLNRLCDWANKWQLRFNPEKCEVMRATHSRDRSKPSYSLGVQLKSIENVKDLAVTINYDLSWGKHVSHIVNKANKVLGVITAVTTNTRPQRVFSSVQTCVLVDVNQRLPWFCANLYQENSADSRSET